MRLEQGPQLVTAEGRVVVRQREARLTAPTLRYSLQDSTAEATGDAVLVQKDVTIKAPQLRFDLREEVTTAQGGVEVAQAGNTLTAASLRYQAKTGDVSADGGVKLIQAGSTLDGRRLLANLQTRRADVREDVTFSKDDTTVTAGRVVFRWDVNEAEAEENVVVRQKDKTAWADRMIYSEPSNRLVMTGRVTLEQMSGDWLTRVGCSRLVMTLRERDVTVEGPLRVTQKDRWATGDRGAYTEATRRLVMTGNVVVQETDGRRLQADRVTISLVDETFEAEGNVQTQFVIPHRP
jgi:lipopolysaccharide assembly outer membrane protein LptD (OstA)